MSVTKITEENIFLFTDLIPKELLGEMEREYFRGLASSEAEDDGYKAAIIWKLNNMELENVPSEAEIIYLMLPDGFSADELFKTFEQSARDEGALKLFFELDSLRSTERSQLEAAGFRTEEAESRDIIVSVGDMARLELGRKTIPPYIIGLSDINARQFKAGVMSSVFHGNYGILDDLPFLPMTYFDPDISSCVITDDKVSGILLVHRTLSGIFVVELLFAIQPDANINLLNMIRHSIRAAAKLCDENDRVILRRHNKASSELLKKLFPDKKGAIVIRGRKDA